MKTGLFDKYGQEININDLVLFEHKDGCKWAGVVIFEDGVITICCWEMVIQIKNPKKWDMQHDWINSRWWSTKVGYGEFGTWNVPRVPITRIADQFENPESYIDVNTPLIFKDYFDFDQINSISARAVNCHIVG